MKLLKSLGHEKSAEVALETVFSKEGGVRIEGCLQDYDLRLILPRGGMNVNKNK
jgi:hypothetical protein